MQSRFLSKNLERVLENENSGSFGQKNGRMNESRVSLPKMTFFVILLSALSRCFTHWRRQWKKLGWFLLQFLSSSVFWVDWLKYLIYIFYHRFEEFFLAGMCSLSSDLEWKGVMGQVLGISRFQESRLECVEITESLNMFFDKN